MEKITQKQLIGQLKMLKEVKPRKEWVFSLKSKIFDPYTKVAIRIEKKPAFLEVPVPDRKENSIGIWDLVFQRRMAYAFSVLLFFIVGVFGFAQHTMPGDLLFPVKKIAEQSQASLTGQPALVATLNNRINDLAQISKEGKTGNIPSAIDEVKLNVTELVKNLKYNPSQDSQTIKEIATGLKTLASVPGTDLSANPEIQDLYQTVVQSQIADLSKTTLTDEQKEALEQAKNLYFEGKYTEALEKILLINK